MQRVFLHALAVVICFGGNVTLEVGIVRPVLVTVEGAHGATADTLTRMESVIFSALALLVSVASFTIAMRAESRASAIEKRAKYQWRIEHVDRGAFLLRNTGTVDATNVTIASDLIIAFEKNAETMDLKSGQAGAFIAVLKNTSGGITVHVTWTPSDGTGERTWSEPVPFVEPA